MTALAPTLEAFFTERLMTQRNASPHTIAGYRDSLRLLVNYIADTTGIQPAALTFDDLDAPTVAKFLDHLETDRGAATATRNARLAAIHSLFRYASLRHPEHAALIARVLDIPTKRSDRTDVDYLTDTEVRALLEAPDPTTRLGRRDRALLAVAVDTGLRVAELVTLRHQDIVLGTGAHLTCCGKGRKHRSTPLTPEAVDLLQALLAETETETDPDAPVFIGPRGTALTTDAVRRVVSRHTATAASNCPTLATKNVTPHVLRHTCAMRLLHAGVDRAVIALWLGHESIRTTDIYQHADLALKERALARTTSITTQRAGRYRPADTLLTFLEAL